MIGGAGGGGRVEYICVWAKDIIEDVGSPFTMTLR